MLKLPEKQQCSFLSFENCRATKVFPRMARETEKGSWMVTFWILQDHSWPQNCNIDTLLEHRYLQHFQHKMKVGSHSDPLWDDIWNPILRAVTTLGSFFGFLCSAGSSWGWKLVTTGSQRGLQRASKITQNRFKITLGPHWWTKACRGVPPGCLRDTQSAYLCIFMHVFLRIRAYSCIFMHVYACIYAYSCIFIHIYAYFMHVSCTRMHIHAYLCIFIYTWTGCPIGK